LKPFTFFPLDCKSLFLPSSVVSFDPSLDLEEDQNIIALADLALGIFSVSEREGRLYR